MLGSLQEKEDSEAFLYNFKNLNSGVTFLNPLIRTSQISSITSTSSIIDKSLLIDQILETLSKAQLNYNNHINNLAMNDYKVQTLIFNKEIINNIDKLTETELNDLQEIFKEKFCKVEDHIPCILWDSACLDNTVSDNILKLHNLIFSGQEKETNYDVDAIIGVVNFTNTSQINAFKAIIEQLPDALYNIAIMDPSLFIGNLGPVNWGANKLSNCLGLYVYGSTVSIVMNLPPVDTMYFAATATHYDLKNIANFNNKTHKNQEKEYLIKSTLAIAQLPKLVTSISLNNILIDPNTKKIPKSLQNMDIEISINASLNFDKDGTEFAKHINLLKNIEFKGLFSWNNPNRVSCEYESISQILNKGLDFYKNSLAILLKKEQKQQKILEKSN